MKSLMKNLSALIASITVFTAINTHAEVYKAKPYVGGNVSGLDLSVTEAPDDLSLLSGYARFGAQFDDYWSLEWRIGTGLQDDEIRGEDGNADVSLDLFYGAYVLGGAPITEHIYPYVAMGYSKAEFEINASDRSAEYKENDISFGAGVNFDVSDKFAINLEYMQYIKENGVELSGPTAGFIYYF
ncbi:MAG TPA: porin family protein [Cellvibrio sp.]|nr:porin family protein [Cellvibrio sp.]